MKDYTDIIIAPVITEKSAAAAEKNVYTFKVVKSATKDEIKNGAGSCSNRACKKGQYGLWCAALMMMDGWQITEDYPW